jgi:hypothetical protein
MRAIAPSLNAASAETVFGSSGAAELAGFSTKSVLSGRPLCTSGMRDSIGWEAAFLPWVEVVEGPALRTPAALFFLSRDEVTDFFFLSIFALARLPKVNAAQ